MVAVQTLLMHYYLLGFHANNQDYLNEVLPKGEVPTCSLGCTNCSPVNGCYSCKPPFLLVLQRDGYRQQGVCKEKCPLGFYVFHRRKNGFCIKCNLRGCSACSNSSSCSKCKKGYALAQGKCHKCRKKATNRINYKNCFIHHINGLNRSTSVGNQSDQNKPKLIISEISNEITLNELDSTFTHDHESHKLRNEDRRRKRKRMRRRKRKKRKRKWRKRKKIDKEKRRKGRKNDKSGGIRHWKRRLRKERKKRKLQDKKDAIVSLLKRTILEPSL